MHEYSWGPYRCTYQFHSMGTDPDPQSGLSLLLIHPIGVGLSGQFWQPLVDHCQQRSTVGSAVVLYVPDLLGCGGSDKPHRAYYPSDWADQLSALVTGVIQQPVVVVVQGALLPVAVRLLTQTPAAAQIRGLVLSGPPAWSLMTQATSPRQQRFSWSLLDSPLGWAFYRYARRAAFLRSFSERQLFARAKDVTDEWLAMLTEGAADMASRHAVFSFLAGLWRQGYAEAMAQLSVPTLVVMGEQASTIDRVASGARDQSRLQDYLQHLPNAKGKTILGRNVLPYESTAAFAEVVFSFIDSL